MARVLKIYLPFFFFLNISIILTSSKLMTSEELDELAVYNFREYLRIPSVQPNVNYSELKIFFNIFYTKFCSFLRIIIK